MPPINISSITSSVKNGFNAFKSWINNAIEHKDDHVESVVHELAVFRGTLEVEGKHLLDAARQQLDAVKVAFNDLVESDLMKATQDELRALALTLIEAGMAIKKVVDENPEAFKILGIVAGTVLIAIGTEVLLPALSLSILRLLGFSELGPVAGSIAAGIQSKVYGGVIKAGSPFAWAQAAAMGRIAATSALELTAGGAAVAAGAGLIEDASTGRGVGMHVGDALGQLD